MCHVAEDEPEARGCEAGCPLPLKVGVVERRQSPGPVSAQGPWGAALGSGLSPGPPGKDLGHVTGPKPPLGC